MVPITSLMVCAVIVWLFVKDQKRKGRGQVFLAPFWYFSFLFLIAFPLRAYLLDADLVTAQVAPGVLASEVYSSSSLVVSLLYATLLWGAIAWGRSMTAGEGVSSDRFLGIAPSFGKGTSYTRVLVVTFGVAGLSLIVLEAISLAYSPRFGGVGYQQVRMGGGPLWIIPELFIWIAFGLFGWWASMRNRKMHHKDLIVFVCVAAAALYISGAFHSRRLVAAIVFGFMVLIALRNTRYWLLVPIAILSTIVVAPVLEFLRTIYVTILKNQPLDVAVIFDSSIHNLIYKLSGSFEGAGHLARFIQQTSVSELLLGVDQGVSWLYNAGLALVPRAIWASKPTIYGGMEQFHWLYPNLFQDGFSTSSVPMSFAVDFAFGFGVVVSVGVAIVFGRLLGIAERSLQDSSAHPVDLALSLFIFVFMFNWVRGGTIVIQSVALFSFAIMLMFSFVPTLRRVLGMAGEMVGLVGGDWRGAQRVYFYPHKYLRERQLDTVRTWSGSPIYNPEIVENRNQTNVAKNNALTIDRPSWKSRLPLVNIKKRPSDVPKDGCVYVWGGLISTGPFISDIDNPYAFTGYNVFATRLFKYIIQSFLLSPRCLQIRCMSQACLDNMRALYGDEVADKCVLYYPHISLKATSALEPSDERCRFVFISSQFELKGGAVLLRAFERVVQACPGASLDLVTYLPDAFKDDVARIPNVHVYEANLTREEVGQRFLSQSDVLVHPTYMDSFGLVVLEGLSYGLPVIATDVYAISEMVEDGRNGFLLSPPISSWHGLEPSDVFSSVQETVALSRSLDLREFEDGLYNAMKELAQNPEQRARLSQHSIELMQTRFAKTS